MPKIKVSIIIVFYSGPENLYKCLSSIKESRPETRYEVIAVDNSEKKEIKSKIAKEFYWVKYIESENRGYGAGNNLGAKHAQGEYLFILNPDTTLYKATLDTLVGFLDKRKNTAVVAPNLLDEEGRVFPQLGSRMLTPIRGMIALSFLNKLFPDNSVSREYWLKDVSMSKLREVDAVPGSAFLIRKEVFEKVGRFDENMFLFFEESDLGKRIKDAGYKIFINPDAEVKHRWTLPREPSKKIDDYFRQSRFYYFKKHYGIIWALTVEAFTRFSKWHAALLFILFFSLVFILLK